MAIVEVMRVSISGAKNKFTQLIATVEKGGSVTVCWRGKPVVDIVPTQAKDRRPPQFGMLKGKIKIIDSNWDKPQNDIEAWFRGDV